MDKVLLKTIPANTLQFYYMLFLCILTFVFAKFSGQSISLKTVKINYWILLLGALLFVGDKVWFIANAMPESKASVMSIIKQSAVILTVVLGKLIYKEKGFAYKITAAGVVAAGIIMVVI